MCPVVMNSLQLLKRENSLKRLFPNSINDGNGRGIRDGLNFSKMTWRELGDFLHLQRRAIDPRLVADFARIGEKRADTFKRLEKATRESLDEAVREFAKTKNWPALSDEEMNYVVFAPELWC